MNRKIFFILTFCYVYSFGMEQEREALEKSKDLLGDAKKCVNLSKTWLVFGFLGTATSMLRDIMCTGTIGSNTTTACVTATTVCIACHLKTSSIYKQLA